MILKQRKEAFIELGRFLSQFTVSGNTKDENVLHNNAFYNDFINIIAISRSKNGWYTPEQVYFAINSWAGALTADNMDTWLENYNLENSGSKSVGLILAGNIPLVGFHDFLSVLITGHKALVKTSSSDQLLLPFLAKYLIAVEPQFEHYITFVKDKLEGFDAVIATGSNNTARYFEYYFKDKPGIIRKNRNSVAVLTGNETREELIALGEDIFRYFGLGCRNVSKLFVPRDYDFTLFFEAMFTYGDIIHYDKYANNYDYNKAVFLMSNFKLLDNGFMTIKEDYSYASPISSIFYEYYDDINDVEKKLELDSEQIQCVVGNSNIKNVIPFGKTQQPELWDYADNVDTIAFLTNI